MHLKIKQCFKAEDAVKPKNECAGHGWLFWRTVGSWNAQDKQGTPEQKNHNHSAFINLLTEYF